MASNLDAALDYLKAGYSVIPVGPDKRPLFSWKEFQDRKASEDEAAGWYGKNPGANVGIVTGKISGITVLDFDSQAAVDYFLENSKGETPCSDTPRGMHAVYAYEEGTRNTVKVNGLDIDVRSDGGYIVAPPSINAEGKPYRWLVSILDLPPAPLPAFLKKFFLYNREQVSHITPVQMQSQYFVEGRRDEDLFHLANCLIKGGAQPDYVRQVLEIAASSCDPPFPERELEAKIKSALDRAAKRERNIAEEIRQWVLVTSGHFMVTDSHRELDLVTPSHRHAANVAFRRLSEGPNPLIERYGSKRGCYRLIENDVEIIDYLNAPVNEFDIDLSLLLSGQLKLYPGNVGIFAGAKSSGKTAIAFDLIKRNQGRHEVVYMNSEMHDSEMRNRLELHQDIRLTDWRFKAIRRGHDWADLITDEKKIFIIDYMENVDGDAWRIGSEIKKIHDKLKEGVAIIFLQKKSGEDLARGGQYTLDKARFYVALDKGKAKIIDAKAFRGENPNGKTLSFKIVQGTKIMPQGTWA